MSSETRIDVELGDGAEIAVWVAGAGQPIVLVHGSLQDHSASESFVDELIADFATFSVDRRGFGASIDSGPWTIERDFDDLAAVIDEVATITGRAVSVWGHSFGAGVAMGAAARTASIASVILYEPSLGLSYPAGCIEAINDLITSGRTEIALTQFLTDVLQLDLDDIADLRSTPRWESMIASAHTIPRESLAERDWIYDGQFDGVTVPTLLLAGSETTPDLGEATRCAAAALPRTEVRELEGHGHLAHRTDPSLVAAIVRDFVLTASTRPAHRWQLDRRGGGSSGSIRSVRSRAGRRSPHGSSGS